MHAVFASVRLCGLVPVPMTDVEAVKDQGGKGRYLNLQSCKSPWSCIECATALERQRGLLLRGVVEEHGQEKVELVTLTVSHAKGNDLRGMRRDMARAWGKMQAHRSFRELGVELVRALEVTYSGMSGWHPHYHVGMGFPEALSPAERERIKALLCKLWIDAVVKVLGAEHAPSVERGVDMRLVRDAAYLTKLVGELTSSSRKESRRPGHLMPWEIARKAADGSPGYLKLWQEYQAAMKGAKALTWSAGWRALRDRVQARLDAEEVDAKKGKPEPVRMLVIPGEQWTEVRHVRLPDGRLGRQAILSAIDAGATVGELQVLLDEMQRIAAPRGRKLPEASQGPPAG